MGLDEVFDRANRALKDSQELSKKLSTKTRNKMKDSSFCG